MASLRAWRKFRQPVTLINAGALTLAMTTIHDGCMDSDARVLRLEELRASIEAKVERIARRQSAAEAMARDGLSRQPWGPRHIPVEAESTEGAVKASPAARFMLGAKLPRK